MNALPMHSTWWGRIAAIVVAAASLAMSPAYGQGSMTTVRLADQPGAEVDYAAVWVAEGLGY
ncbi:MAG TPA: hypothetical protein VGL67_04710, partial [Casimicrobiaceae bacterium]